MHKHFLDPYSCVNCDVCFSQSPFVTVLILAQCFSRHGSGVRGGGGSYFSLLFSYFLWESFDIRLNEELHNYIYVAKQLQPFLTRDFVLQRTCHSMSHCWRKIFLYIGLDRQTHARIMVSLKPEVSIISPVWCSLHLPFLAWKKCCKPFQLNIPSPRYAFSN